jgi:predicted nucleic acid-binding protein
MPVLLDTGVIYALADRDDAWHARAVAWVGKVREPLLTAVTVVSEVAYLVATRLGDEVERRFIGSIVARELLVEDLKDQDWARAAELMRVYPTIGFVDASVVAIAERLRLASIATTDRRHFTSIRPRHRDRFDLVP